MSLPKMEMRSVRASDRPANRAVRRIDRASFFYAEAEATRMPQEDRVVIVFDCLHYRTISQEIQSASEINFQGRLPGFEQERRFRSGYWRGCLVLPEGIY